MQGSEANHLAKAAHCRGLGDSVDVKDFPSVTGTRGMREEDAIRHREDADARGI